MLGRRIIGEIDIVLPHDPAIAEVSGDEGIEQAKKFADKLFARDAVEIRPGEEPTIWRVRPLTVRQHRALSSFETGELEWSEVVVRCCLVRVTGYDLEGQEFEQPDSTDNPTLGRVASQDWIDRCPLTTEDKTVLARCCWMISEARPLSSRPSARHPGDGGKSKTAAGRR